ncbi:MAG: ABC transporter ATP-binding protein, partial [Lachnospiraceae bacterium]|nr:ABC transporter ATP-binding protein [Lachnospiraceae bacterium]
ISSYAARFWQPIMNLGNIFNNVVNNMAYLERIFETMNEKVEVDDAPDAVEMPPIKGKVEFENVSFSYDESKEVLHNVSFTVEPGMSVALVGPTGAGKSTIVNLISRFYNVESGRVLIDGQDISKVTLHSLRSQMGIMMQDSFIFSGTIKDNILYGKLDATDEEIVRASEKVCADSFIRRMPDGYDTEVKERGSLLSQGQKQLISFARTLLSDPSILILDEATSSIDVQTEKALQQGLNTMLQGRTSFIIAHRLSTIRNCDLIMYIDDGGIMEAGTHEQLMAKGDAYYHLYTAQLEDIA